MVKLVERVRQIINVRADLMGCSFLTGTVHHCIEAAQLTHQIFFGSALRLFQAQVFQALSLFLILGKDRFNTHDCIQNIRTRVSLEGSEAIDIALRAMLNPGDEVLIPQPSYVSYTPCTILADGVPVTIQLEEKDKFRLTKEKLLEKITPKTKVLVLPFPNNPTGSIMEAEDLAEIAKVCVEKDLFVISDEIYSELTYKGQHCTIAAFPGMKERTVLINGFSKSFAMTGWRLGYACAPEIILKQMLKIHQFAIMCAPTTSQYAAVEALRNGDHDVVEMREAYDQRRRYLVKALRDMGFDCYEPQGAFYVFPSIKKFGMTSDEFALKLLEEEKVAVVPGTAFGDCGEGYLRISYAYSLNDLKRALERMERFVKRHLNEEK